MASRPRITNITNGFNYKRTHAERAIRNCAAEWVEYGVSIRSLTLAESIEARNRQAALREWRKEPLPYAEIFGLRFDPSVSGIPATRRENKLLWEAHDFMRQATA